MPRRFESKKDAISCDNCFSTGCIKTNLYPVSFPKDVYQFEINIQMIVMNGILLKNESNHFAILLLCL